MVTGKEFLETQLEGGFIGGLVQEPRFIHDHPRDSKYYSGKTDKEERNPGEIVEEFGIHDCWKLRTVDETVQN